MRHETHTKQKLNRVFWCSVLVMLWLPATLMAAQILSVSVEYDKGAVPLNIGDRIHFVVVTDAPGEVVVDIANVHQGISLRDDGMEGDRTRGDNRYELDYIIHPGDTIAQGPVIAHFITPDGQRIDTPSTDPNLPRLTIDASRPEITNDGVTPNPFNPENGPAYLRYSLTEDAFVIVEISTMDGQLVRTLGLPSGHSGENQATWDGTNDQGRLVDDGQYRYTIHATDSAGNEAFPVSGGVILSTIRLQIDQTVIAPNPFYPDGNEVNDGTRISFRMFLYASEEQLRVVGMDHQNWLTVDTADDDTPTPFALVGITFLDAAGSAVHVMEHDVTPDSDTDFTPSGWPNRRPPMESPVGSRNYLGGDLPDYGDDVDNNDWDTLIPFDGPFGMDGKSYFTASFSVQWKPGVGIPSGTYLVNIETELTGRTWEFVDYLREQDRITGEMWHAIPTHHFGVRAQQRTQFVTVNRQRITPPDDDAPRVASTDPSDGSVIDPAQREVREISVVLEDDADGSGVDLTASRLMLLNPLGNQVQGRLQPYDLNTLKLSLNVPLAASGEYTISVVAVDKRGNQSEPIDRTFTIQDTSAPTVVPNTLAPAPVEAAYSTPIQEVQVVLDDGATGSGVDMEKSALLVKNAANVTIEGELITDAQTNLMRYQLRAPLPSDIYTIVIIAVDKAGTQAIYTEQFRVDLRMNIELREDDRVYGVIYAGTQVVAPASLDPRDIQVGVTDALPALLPELRLLGEGVYFEPSGVLFDEPVQIEMAYPGDALPPDVDSSSIKLYAYFEANSEGADNAQARSGWQEVANVQHDPDGLRLVARTERLAAYYAVTQLRDAASVLAREVRLSRDRFWPEQGQSLSFTFPNTTSDVYVEIYNVGGELIRSLRSSTNVVTWDGKNQQNNWVRQGVFICRLRYIEQGQFQAQHKLVAVLR